MWLEGMINNLHSLVILVLPFKNGPPKGPKYKHSVIKQAYFFVRFKGNSIFTKNAETRILLQNSILFLKKLIFPAFL